MEETVAEISPDDSHGIDISPGNLVLLLKCGTYLY